MGNYVKLLVLFIPTLCVQAQLNWLDGSDLVTGQARDILSSGDQVMTVLENKIRERRDAVELAEKQSSRQTWMGIDFVDCASMIDNIKYGESLLLAGGDLYSRASNEFHTLTSCLQVSSSIKCWTEVVAELPRYLEKFKPLTSCYVNNVYYTVEQIDYYFKLCMGSEASPPHPPPKTFEQCQKDNE